MKKYIGKYIFGFISAILLLISCESWLEVKMKDKILENSLFESLEGYTTALNGIYAELNSPDIYGKNLSMGAIDVMAQYYDVQTPENHVMSTYAEYDFKQDPYKNMFFSVWSKMYSLLANVNLLLENCNGGSVPLPGVMRGLITGETYALRGMLHFDLLRLYGPCYSDETKSIKVMPYMTSSDRRIQPMLSAEEVAGLVIDDLKKAVDLLKGNDPVIEEGPKNGSKPTDVDNSLNYRQYRLNYYAVKALLARVYLWIGNREKAVDNAKDVIAVAEGEKAWFPFTDKGDVLTENRPDKIFSTEVLFGLYNSSRNNIYKSMFHKEVKVESRLTLSGTYQDGRIRVMYDNENDVRFSSWENGMVDTVEVLYNTKFADNDDPRNHYMIPLVRTSEMYLLLAECSASASEVADYVNRIRFARGALNAEVTPENKDRLLAEEYAREMMGEGQLYLFYKRRAMTSIPSGKTKDKYMEMPLVNYVWPLPDAEIENRPKF